jgi:hypothetical protein
MTTFRLDGYIVASVFDIVLRHTLKRMFNMSPSLTK